MSFFISNDDGGKVASKKSNLEVFCQLNIVARTSTSVMTSFYLIKAAFRRMVVNIFEV